MDQDSFLTKLFRLGFWAIAMGIVLIWFFVLILPVFLPAIRASQEQKYEGFQYKTDLVNEAMRKYTVYVWLACIASWGLFIFAARHSGL